MQTEKTLVLIKPDGVKNKHIGDIISIFERKGYTISQLKVCYADKDLLKKHYAHIADKPFFPEVVEYMTEGPIVAMVIEGVDIVNQAHMLAGPTNPKDALLDTIRGQYSMPSTGDTIKNVIHTSDTVENAKREIDIWFK